MNVNIRANNWNIDINVKIPKYCNNIHVNINTVVFQYRYSILYCILMLTH